MNFRNYMNAVVIALLVLPMSGLLWAQDTAVQEAVDYKKVIADYIEATGGEMAHKAIKSIAAKGTISIPAAGLEGDVEMTQADGKAFMKMVVAGIGEQTVGYDGETAWQVNQMTGPEILEGDRREQFVRQMSISPFLEAEETYDSIECTGVEEFNGEDCHVVVMKAGESEPVYNFFSVESKLLLGNKMTTSDPMMGKMELVTKQSDYKEVAGVQMSHTSTVEMSNGMQMITEIEEFTVNSDVKDSLFDLPDEIKELKEDAKSDDKDDDKDDDK